MQVSEKVKKAFRNLNHEPSFKEVIKRIEEEYETVTGKWLLDNSVKDGQLRHFSGQAFAYKQILNLVAECNKG